MSNYRVYGFVLTTDKEVTELVGTDKGDGLELFYFDDPYGFVGVYCLDGLNLQPIEEEDFDTIKEKLVAWMAGAGKSGILNVAPDHGYMVEDVDTFEYMEWSYSTASGLKVGGIVGRGDTCSIEPGDSEYADLAEVFDMAECESMPR